MIKFQGVLQVSLDDAPSKGKPPPQNCIWSRYDLDLWTTDTQYS